MRSHALPAPAIAPQFPHDGVPSVPDQRRIVAAAQQIALNYAKSLPDFICTEVIRRYDDTRGGFDLRDTLDVKLTYFDQQENYRLLTVNGRPSIKPFESVGGAVSKGEFGSMLYSIFLGESKATFRWDHWTTLRKHIAHVFSFRILAANSMYQMQFSTGPAFGKSGIIAGQHGFVYVDRETEPDPPDRGRGRQYSARLPRQAVLNAARLRLHGRRRPVVSAPDSRRGADGNRVRPHAQPGGIPGLPEVRRRIDDHVPGLITADPRSAASGPVHLRRRK